MTPRESETALRPASLPGVIFTFSTPPGCTSCQLYIFRLKAEATRPWRTISWLPPSGGSFRKRITLQHHPTHGLPDNFVDRKRGFCGLDLVAARLGCGMTRREERAAILVGNDRD